MDNIEQQQQKHLKNQERSDTESDVNVNPLSDEKNRFMEITTPNSGKHC